MTVDFPERLHKHAHDLDADGHDTASGDPLTIDDGSTTVTPVTSITFDGSTVTDDGGGAATVQFSPAGSVNAIDVVFDPTSTDPPVAATDVQTAIEQILGALAPGHEHGHDEYTGDGVETQFTIGAVYDRLSGTVHAYFDGIRTDSSVTWTINDDGGLAQVDFAVAPGNGVVIQFDWTEVLFV